MVKEESFDVIGPLDGQIYVQPVTTTSTSFDVSATVVGAALLSGRTLALRADGCKVYYSWGTVTHTVDDTNTGSGNGRCGVIPDGQVSLERLNRPNGQPAVWLSVRAASGASGTIRISVATQDPINKYL
jgi:hypothetical protein